MIRNNISELRKKNNITQDELANELNVSRQTIISLENNNSNISLELAFNVAKYFDMPINDIFYEKNNNLDSIEKIRLNYGKHTIIIKDNLVFRCGTEKLEIGPQSLYSLNLPLYGQMKKFVIINDHVYELIATRDYESRTDIVLHHISNEVDIDYSFIDFDEKLAWNYKKF